MSRPQDPTTGAPSPQEALLPCPFCGGSPKHVDHHRDGDWVYCPGCKVCTRAYANGADAIAAWNRRTPQASVVPTRSPEGKP